MHDSVFLDGLSPNLIKLLHSRRVGRPTLSKVNPPKQIQGLSATALPKALYRDVDVAWRYSIDRTTVWRWAAENGAFPQPVTDCDRSRWQRGDLLKFEMVFGDAGDVCARRDEAITIDERFLRIEDVALRYSVSTSSIIRWSKASFQFPGEIKISKGATRYRLSDLLSFESHLAFGGDDRIGKMALPRRDESFLPDRDVAALLGKSRQTIRRWASDPDQSFPRSLLLSEGTSRWRTSEVIGWAQLQGLTSALLEVLRT